ncbi:dTDP-4-amino-4,6-dideoxygalactose transaminase, partial [Akkermansia muciniphila]|nr:dTDP-4-amino-4,6-dideoxygalactose transaminase [Akkermansia muciniphila]
MDVGSSYLPGEMCAAYLYAQLEQGQEINGERLKWWNRYPRALAPWEEQGVRRNARTPQHPLFFQW